jgi:hypothetical protein
MKRVGLIALLTLAAGAAAATAAGRHSAGPTANRCGGELWRLKTLSDVDRRRVELGPRGTTIAAIGERPYPRPIPRRRRTPFQRQSWQVVAQVTRYKLETGGLRLELYDGGAYLNSVIPQPSCLTRRTRARDRIAQAWKEFLSRCQLHPTTEWQTFGAIMYVRGIGFWSQRRFLRGSARNGAELHPMTGFDIVTGCR